MLKKSLLILILFNFFLLSEIFSHNPSLEVSFLDVGQGDSILIKSPTSQYVLIDGGNGGNVVEKLSRVMPFGKREIDLIIATHPDQDHIGGLIQVFDLYDVKNFLFSDVDKGTQVSETLIKKVKEENSYLYYAKRGLIVDLGRGAYLETLFPDRNLFGVESNTGSVVNRLVFKEKSFLFTGDSPKSIEKYLKFLDGDTLKSEVLKIGHHGSKTSSDESFLRTVSPEFAILSYGKDNRYGHPSLEVINLLDILGIKKLATAELGTITFITDGETLEIK